jgi:glyceraldehyde-3-phosphate dehydrogenase/erythrose-4-phosphate dehydrogenase
VRYSYYCVPTPIGSLAELTGFTDRAVGRDEVNRAMAEAAAGYLGGVLDYDPIRRCRSTSGTTRHPAFSTRRVRRPARMAVSRFGMVRQRVGVRTPAAGPGAPGGGT